MPSLIDRILWDFEYHAPDPVRTAAHEDLRYTLRQCAVYMAEHLPEGREKSLVITHLEEAMFWANAAIARQDRPA